MLKHWWRILRAAFIAVGTLLCFFAIIELIRAYQTLNALHPIAGYVFLAVLAGLIVCLLVYFTTTLGARPPVLIPPAHDPKNPRRYAAYLIKYLNLLSVNLSQKVIHFGEGPKRRIKSIVPSSSSISNQELPTAGLLCLTPGPAS